MSGRARKNRMARGRLPQKAQSGAPVEGEQPGNGSSRGQQRQRQGRQAPEPAAALEVAPAPASTQARGGAEISAQPSATARAPTCAEILTRPAGRARAPAWARAAVPIRPPLAPAPASELVRHEEPRGAEGGAEVGASTFPEEEGQVSARLRELTQRKKQRGKQNIHDIGVNTRQNLRHFIECKRGTSGTVVQLKTNHFRLTALPQWALYQYHVNFNPQMDSKRLRSVLLDVHKQLLGKCYSFDGAILFLCHRLRNKVTEVFSQTHSGENVRITITLTNELLPNSPTCLQFYNIIFKRFLNTMNLVQIGRNFYDICNGAEDMRDLRFNICPGFITSILQYENDIMLCTDVSHKVVRKDTVLDLINDFQRSGRHTAREDILKEIRGQIVYTKHNNRTYRVDDIDWEQNPRSTFEKDGSDISFLNYYRQQYRAAITDLEQPVLVSLPKRKKGPDGRLKSPALLMPELCNLTGLTRSMRMNDRVTKNIANRTRLSPEKRYSELQKLVDNIHRNTDVQRELQEWGLDFDKQSLSLTARVLPVQKLNEDRRAMSICCTDWSKEIKRGQLSYPKPLNNWLLVFNYENERLAQILWEKLNITTRALGINLRPPLQWYSWCFLQKPGQEFLDGLMSCLETALGAWKKNNKQCPLPKFIFVYRDGVGDGQLQTMVDYEVPQILRCLNSHPNYSYKLVVIVVKKRLNARFFVEKNGRLENPSAGTVIDVEVTRPEWYDFFIISQSVRVGTVMPTHYNVIFDNTDLTPDQIQCLTYKLCYMYYNWTGVIRVPAPCQYAHKLAFLVGQSIRKNPHKALSDSLYYL
uniref:Piwi-like protein 1 isoform X4 n=1 Tax=Phascolarctos cinereus TaxID=38626 RepID=A0A6P5LNS9_PHACI|nr:piwi-like protein 1 isoform X4 [Phascolarctos cinereus]